VIYAILAPCSVRKKMLESSAISLMGELYKTSVGWRISPHGIAREEVSDEGFPVLYHLRC
jgi:hypothetical protein